VDGNALVGYTPTFSTSSTSTVIVANPGGLSAGSPNLVSSLQPDGASILAANVICGVSAGRASVTATTSTNEIAYVSSPLSRSQDVSVVGGPATIELVAEPSEIVCDGSETAAITARVRDASGEDV